MAMKVYSKQVRSKKVIRGIFVCLVVVGLGILLAIPPLVMGDMINVHVDFYTASIYPAEQITRLGERLP